MIDNEKYLRTFFGNAADYYIDKYRGFQNGQRFTFNVAPFFLGGLWFLYRKLWSESLIIILTMVLVGMIEQAFYARLGTEQDVQTGIMMGFNIALGVAFGFTGNYLYMLKAEKAIQKITTLTTNEDERLTLLSVVGGISWIPFALAGLVLVMLAFGGGARL